MSALANDCERRARELLAREYGPDHPAAKHRFSLSFLTTTHEHQVRELAEAMRAAVVEHTGDLENLGTENSRLRAQIARMHQENAALSDGLEECERQRDALLVAVGGGSPLPEKKP